MRKQREREKTFFSLENEMMKDDEMMSRDEKREYKKKENK